MATWILISDVARAKLFRAERANAPWSLVEEFEHPEGHQPSREISPSSAPGRIQKSPGGRGPRTSMEPHTTPKDVEAGRFAHHLVDRLEQAALKNEFEKLVLVAPPRFLGQLNAVLGRHTASRLQTTVDKDLAMLSDHELRERLIDVAFPPTSAASTA